MTKMIPFRLNIELGTPVAITGTLTLDALLTKAAFNMTGFTDDRLRALIPLRCQDGIFSGSILRYSGQQRRTTVSFVRKLVRSDMWSYKFKSNIKRSSAYGIAGVDYAPIELEKGPFCARLESIQVVESPRAHFYGFGDPDAVVRLIENFLPGIGKRANAGLGEIRGVSWTHSPDYSLIDKNGHPARPIPIELWHALAANGGKVVEPTVGLRPVDVPGWCSEKIPCAMPVL